MNLITRGTSKVILYSKSIQETAPLSYCNNNLYIVISETDFDKISLKEVLHIEKRKLPERLAKSFTLNDILILDRVRHEFDTINDEMNVVLEYKNSYLMTKVDGKIRTQERSWELSLSYDQDGGINNGLSISSDAIRNGNIVVDNAIAGIRYEDEVTIRSERLGSRIERLTTSIEPLTSRIESLESRIYGGYNQLSQEEIQ